MSFQLGWTSNSSNTICFPIEFDDVRWFHQNPQFVEFDKFYNRIRWVDICLGIHASNQNWFGFICELDKMSMPPHPWNSKGSISEFDELSTRSCRFINSLNSQCFTSELGGIYQLSDSLNSLYFPSEFRWFESSRVMSQELQIRYVFLANVVSKFVYEICPLGRRILYTNFETKFGRFYKRNG